MVHVTGKLTVRTVHVGVQKFILPHWIDHRMYRKKIKGLLCELGNSCGDKFFRIIVGSHPFKKKQADWDNAMNKEDCVLLTLV